MHPPEEVDFIDKPATPRRSAARDVLLRGSWFDRAAVLLATGLGVGLIPIAPGTFGSLVGLLWAWTLSDLPWFERLVVLGVCTAASIPVCGRAAALCGAKDPGSVVLDEICALPIVLALSDWTIPHAILAFALFRLFDIWKPWPARRVEHWHGGLGIVADDTVAALYALAVFTVFAGVSPSP